MLDNEANKGRAKKDRTSIYISIDTTSESEYKMLQYSYQARTTLHRMSDTE